TAGFLVLEIEPGAYRHWCGIAPDGCRDGCRVVQEILLLDRHGGGLEKHQLNRLALAKADLPVDGVAIELRDCFSAGRGRRRLQLPRCKNRWFGPLKAVGDEGPCFGDAAWIASDQREARIAVRSATIVRDARAGTQRKPRLCGIELGHVIGGPGEATREIAKRE